MSFRIEFNIQPKNNFSWFQKQLILLLAFLFLGIFPAWAQQQPVQKEKVETVEEQIYVTVGEMPKYPGGEAAMQQFLHHQLKGIDLIDKPEGLTILQFIVTTAGEIKEITVLKSLESTLDQAARDAIMKMPRWIPGTSTNGEKVNVRYILPVRFGNENLQKIKTKQKKKS
jgi:hypothetical protein